MSSTTGRPTCVPKLRWTQRNAAIYLTYDVHNAVNVKVTYPNGGTAVSFHATDKDSGNDYATTIMLYGGLHGQGANISIQPKHVRVVVPKAVSGEWDRLTLGPAKDVRHYISYDWELDNTLPDDPPPPESEGPESDDESKPTNAAAAPTASTNTTTTESSKKKSVQELCTNADGTLTSDSKKKLQSIQAEMDKLLAEEEERGLTYELTSKELTGMITVACLIVALFTFLLTRWIYLN
eukprot:PhM_4_TR201/c0_g1_i1/m.47501